MAFRVYKPKNVVKVRAEQVLPSTIEDLADRLMGRIAKDTKDNVTGLEVPTFAEPLVIHLTEWIIRTDDNSLSKMSDAEFKDTYEVARNTNGS